MNGQCFKRNGMDKMKNDAMSYEQKILLNKFKQYVETGRPNELSDVADPSARLGQLHKDIDILQHNIGHEYYRPLEPGNRIKKNLKRAARKSIAWFMKPAFDQQTIFNAKTSASLLNLTTVAQDMYSEFVLRTQQMNLRLDGVEKMVSDTNFRLAQLQTREEELIKIEQNNKEKHLEQYAKLQEEVEELQKLTQKFEGILAAGKIESRSENQEPLKRESFIKTYYAQSGEDAIINYILRMLDIPYEEANYLDLGANHAKELSNTYFLYTQQAKGVLVEANPVLAEELSVLRLRDTVINRCVGLTSGEQVDFYILNGDGLSTPDREAAEHFCKVNPALKIEEVVTVETISVNDIIEHYLDSKAPVLLSIDIEGMEKEIIQSIDFERYRPLIVISEMIDYAMTLADHKNTELLSLLEERGYIEYAFTGINSIFVDKQYIDRVSRGKEA